MRSNANCWPGIARIGLPALEIRLHIGWRHQAHLVAKLDNLARPIVACPARLDANQTRLDPLEKPSHLRTTQRLLHNNIAGAVNGMDLKNVLGQIKADCGNLHCGWLLWLVVA